MNNDIILTIRNYLRERYDKYEISLVDNDLEPSIRISNHTNLQIYADLDGSELHFTNHGHHSGIEADIASDGLSHIITIDLTHPNSIQQLTTTLDTQLHQHQSPKTPSVTGTQVPK